MDEKLFKNMRKSYTLINHTFYEACFNFSSSRWGERFLILWSFLEASFWFIAPDFLLVIFGVLKPRMKNKFFILAILASCVGGIFYYLLNVYSFNTMAQILSHTPFVKERMFDYVREIYESQGLWGVLIQPYSYISFKIWTHLAVEANLNPIGYFALVMGARSVRFYLSTMVASFLGGLFKNSIKNHFITIICIFAVVFISRLLILE